MRHEASGSAGPTARNETGKQYRPAQRWVPSMTALVFSVAAALMTLLGGLFALRFKDRLHLILGFSAGAVLGVAFFDLIPESISVAQTHFGPAAVLGIVVVGFAAFLTLDRAMSPSPELLGHESSHRGALGAASLCAHSYLDGFVIGLAFKVSPSVGAIVSIAVLVHDFSDGINTVGIVLGHKGSDRTARQWLLVDAIAPVAGVLSTAFLALQPETLAALLALCGGFFVYLSTSDLLPESYHGHPKALSTLATVLGIVVVYLATRLAS